MSEAAAAAIVLGLRIWTVSQAWLDYERWLAELSAKVITPGARLLAVQAPLPEQRQPLPEIPRNPRSGNSDSSRAGASSRSTR
jgi:hypothetical protein